MRHYIEDSIQSVLLTKEQIAKRVAELGAEITKDYEGKQLIAAAILRGSVIFFSDLIRCVPIPLQVDFMAVTSYGSGSTSMGNVRILFDLQDDIKGKDLLIVEDIIDTGITLSNLRKVLCEREPNTVEFCCLLNKPDRRRAEVDVKYVGFDIPDEFVVGYGLDYDSKYRNYDSIGILKREIYERR